tara:strand:+ start:405 stop:551 length:147 start_codon:yes stop_codon:yes gene_type:complete
METMDANGGDDEPFLGGVGVCDRCISDLLCVIGDNDECEKNVIKTDEC